MRSALIVIFSALLALVLITSAQAETNVRYDVNVNVSNRPAQPVVVAPPAPPGQVVVINEPPQFIMPPSLGFYVSVGSPQDVFYIDGSFYHFTGGVWYRAPYYTGPWGVVKHKHLPYGLRKHRYEEIRAIRDAEYRTYSHDPQRYRGRHFKADKQWKEREKEHRKSEKQYWKEREKEWKREEKEERRHEKRHGRDD